MASNSFSPGPPGQTLLYSIKLLWWVGYTIFAFHFAKEMVTRPTNKMIHNQMYMTVMTGYKNIFVQLHQHISTPIITPWGHHLPLGHPSNHGAGAQAWTARRHRWSGPGSWSSQRWRLWGRAKGPTLKPPKKLIGGMGWLLVVINGYIIYIKYIYLQVSRHNWSIEANSKPVFSADS